MEIFAKVKDFALIAVAALAIPLIMYFAESYLYPVAFPSMNIFIVRMFVALILVLLTIIIKNKSLQTAFLLGALIITIMAYVRSWGDLSTSVIILTVLAWSALLLFLVLRLYDTSAPKAESGTLTIPLSTPQEATCHNNIIDEQVATESPMHEMQDINVSPRVAIEPENQAPQQQTAAKATTKKNPTKKATTKPVKKTTKKAAATTKKTSPKSKK